MELRDLRYFIAVAEEGSLTLAQVDAAVEAAGRATQPARKPFGIGFLTGHEMNWLPRAMHVLRDVLKNIHVTICGATFSTGPRKASTRLLSLAAASWKKVR